MQPVEKSELSLPFTLEMLEPFHEIPTSVIEIQGLSSSEVWQRNKKKLSVTTKAVQQFCDVFLAYSPISVLECSGAWEFRYSVTKETEDLSLGNNLYLPADEHDIQVELDSLFDRYDIESKELLEFFTHFHGLKNSSFRHGFVSEFDPFSYTELEIEEDWEDAVVLFSEGTGDLLLMNEDQKIAWYYCTKSALAHYANDFSEFLEKFTDFKSKYLDCFGSYNSFAPRKPRSKIIAG